MADTIAEALAQAADIYSQFQLTRYSAVAAWAWLVYDMILTFPLEVKHIWRRDFRLPQALYLLIRYYALAFLSYFCTISLLVGLSVEVCNTYFKAQAFGLPPFSLAVNVLLILRLHAIYNNRNVTAILVALLIAQQTIATVITTQAALSAHALPTPPEVQSWPGCFNERLDKSPRYTTGAWVAALVLDSIFFALTLYKLWKLRANGVEIAGIIVVFARDGAMFFGMIFILELANTLINALEPLGPLIGAGSPWIIAGWGIAASRLVLNLREFSGKDDQAQSTMQTQTSGMEMGFRRRTTTYQDETLDTTV